MSDSRKDAGAPVRAVAIVACVIAAVAALGLHVLASWDLYLTGFPDGHLTDYDKAVDSPKRILMWAELGFVPLFLALAFSPIGTRARGSDSSPQCPHWASSC